MKGARGDFTGTVERVAAVMRVVIEAGDSVGVKEVATALELPMSTCHRLFDLLISQGFLEKNAVTHRYSVGIDWFRLASLTLSKYSFNSLVQPVLEELTSNAGETSLFTIYLPSTNNMMFAAKSDSPELLRYRVDLNVSHPLAWGATGHAILAYLPQDARERAIAASGRSPVGSLPIELPKLELALETVREKGYAISHAEKLPGAIGIAVPVFGAPQTVTGSIAFTVPQVRHAHENTERLLQLLRTAASKLSGTAMLRQQMA